MDAHVMEIRALWRAAHAIGINTMEGHQMFHEAVTKMFDWQMGVGWQNRVRLGEPVQYRPFPPEVPGLELPGEAQQEAQGHQ